MISMLLSYITIAIMLLALGVVIIILEKHKIPIWKILKKIPYWFKEVLEDEKTKNNK